jgi:hypothetical protein
VSRPRQTRKGCPLDGVAIAAGVPTALWAGPTLAGLSLVNAEQQTLRTTFDNRAAPQTGTGLALDYGVLGADGRLDWSQSYVRISGSRFRNRSYITIEASTQDRLLAAARTLKPATTR